MTIRYSVEALGAGACETTARFEDEQSARVQFDFWQSAKPTGSQILNLYRIEETGNDRRKLLLVHHEYALTA